MSGGQQQRVSIARARINNPKVLYADEPTGNLDSKTTKEIMDILVERVKEKGVTLVMVTHNAKLTEHADRVIYMLDGKIQKIVDQQRQTVEEFFPDEAEDEAEENKVTETIASIEGRGDEATQIIALTESVPGEDIPEIYNMVAGREAAEGASK
jgi:ABC-type lipoprotein export system ATPase subunit